MDFASFTSTLPAHASSLTTVIWEFISRAPLLQSSPTRLGYHLPLALPAILLFLVFCFCLSQPRHDYKDRDQEIRQGLQALLTVITPTPAWLKDYSPLVLPARSKTAKLLLSDLTKAICSGEMELRDSSDLPDLFCKRLRVYGWLVCLHVEASWWLTVLRWVLSCQFRSFQPITMNPGKYMRIDHTGRLETQFYPVVEPLSPSALRKLDRTKTSRQAVKSVTFLEGSEEITKPISCSLTPPLVSRNTPSSVYLDFVPHPLLETSIRNLQSDLRKGELATLEFTTLAPNITFLSTSFILCAFPFLPRKHLAQNQKHKTAMRTSTPLLTSLHRVIELLTSKLSIESVLNISANCVTGLNVLERELEDDRGVRTAFINKWGVEGWREHRFLIAWEAGLLSAGYISRWIVVVRN